MTNPQTTTEKLVDEFIASTYGECDPVRYRNAMIKFWGKALKDWHDTGWENAKHVEGN